MSIISGLKSLLGFKDSADDYEYERIEPYLEGGPMDPAENAMNTEAFEHEEAKAFTKDMRIDFDEAVDYSRVLEPRAINYVGAAKAYGLAGAAQIA